MAIILETINVDKAFPGIRALSSVSTVFHEGTIHGIIGENGAGKSTLVKILTGVYQADSGQVLISGADVKLDTSLHKQIGYVPQEIDLFAHLSVAENLVMPFERSGLKGMFLKRSRMNELVRPWLKRFNLELNPNTLVREISVSQQQLLQIARAAAYESCKVLILDEPTTSLSANDVGELFSVLRELRREGKSIIFISHKLDELTDICDDLTVLRNGEVVGHAAINDVTRDWIITRMLGRDLNEKDTFIPRNPGEEEILRVDNLSGQGFENISFTLRRGEILGFAGLIGAGRSEIMQTIFGLRKAISGSVAYKGETRQLGNPARAIEKGIFYLPEERKQQAILPLLSVKDNIATPLIEQTLVGPFISPRKERALVNETMARYDVRAPSVNTGIVYLSGGNQQKAIIGRTMMQTPEVLIFDEPTKGIDVGTKAEIYKLMRELVEEQKVSIILISSDVQELMRCANRVIAIYHGQLHKTLEGKQLQEPEVLDAILGGQADPRQESPL